MARLSMVSIKYDSTNLWATIVNYPDSPSTFEVSFFKEFGPSDIPKISLEKINGKLELAKNSPSISEELLIAVMKALESHAVEKSIAV